MAKLMRLENLIAEAKANRAAKVKATGSQLEFGQATDGKFKICYEPVSNNRARGGFFGRMRFYIITSGQNQMLVNRALFESEMEQEEGILPAR